MSGNRPKLRPLDVQPVVQAGHNLLLLRDPLALADRSVIIPAAAAPILALCDGTRDADGLRTALAVRFGVRAEPEGIAGLLAALDQTYLLDNERSAEAKKRALVAFRTAPFRPPALAGGAYPAAAAELSAQLEGYVAAGRSRYGTTRASTGALAGRGLVSPHIDYARGGPVYGAVWDAARDFIREADLAIIFGTDHNGGLGKLTLTRQHYATPFGVLPTAQNIVDDCAAAVNEPFAEELHHRSEHSIELAAVWLHYIREARPCEVVPILCGSFAHFIAGQADPASDPNIAGLVRALQAASSGRRVVVIAAADLAHIGPAFGGEPVDAQGVEGLRLADSELLDGVMAGDPTRFLMALQQVEDRNNVCGLPPIYLALRLLTPVAGVSLAYDHCPADDAGASLVSVAGVVWS